MKKYSYLLFYIPFLALMGWYILRDTRDEFSLNCTFGTSQSNNASIAPVSLPHKSILLFKGQAILFKSEEARDILHFDGNLSWQHGKENLIDKGSVSIFTDEHGDIGGLALFLSNSEKSYKKDFTIATLNEDGWLGFDKKKVYIFRNPDEKLIYSMPYDCQMQELN